MRAWFAGEFDRCLELCDRVRRNDPDTRSQVALLRARAYLRIGRAPEAHRILSDVFVAHGTLDASLTAQMLLGAAEVRIGAVEAGLARLEAAQKSAATAHPTIRSEIALNRALAYYADGDHRAASAALADVDRASDIVHARALEYEGWIATARGRHDEAARHFVAAIERLDTCRQQDRFLEANALQALSYLAAERFDDALWSFIETRAAGVDWTADGLALPRWWITMSSAFVHEAAGRTLQAFAAAREAVYTAPTPAYRVHALLRRSIVARNVGEQFSPLDTLHSARAAFDAIDPRTLTGDERTVPLVLAEAFAQVAREMESAEALDLARRYERLYCELAPMTRVSAMSQDPRTPALEHAVRATIAEAAGDTATAYAAYNEAFRAHKALGFRRRAAACAYRLGELTGFDHFYAYVVESTRDVDRSYWLRRLMRRRECGYRDPIARNLTPSQREVLVAICQGKTNGEIARLRDRSESTIKHIVTELLRAFGVESREQLIVACARRLSVVEVP
ncbi:MAG: Two component transcriptional regulator, LuxR family [Candidatus Eremiobacteraeota bacterium]|nr:Two component transcriptional regulator, LuxR family [Candidatus Eremiobacteraeota bacterium]